MFAIADMLMLEWSIMLGLSNIEWLLIFPLYLLEDMFDRIEDAGYLEYPLYLLDMFDRLYLLDMFDRPYLLDMFDCIEDAGYLEHPQYLLDIFYRIKDARFDTFGLSVCKDRSDAGKTIRSKGERLRKSIANINKNLLEEWKILKLYAVVVSAVALLCFIYMYLIGYIDRGSSSGSLEFRDTYISIILFQGSYVWIKSREVAPKGVYCRSTQDKQGRITLKYEPRFKPPRERGLGPNKPQILNWIYLGQYDTRSEAEILYQIAAFYYEKDEGRLDLGNGLFFTIPAMSEDDRSLYGTEKVKWVKCEAMRVYKDFKKAKLAAANNLPPTSPRSEHRDDDDLVQEMFQEMLQENMDGCVNDQFQQPVLANQTLNAGMNMAMQDQFAQLVPNTDDGFNFNTSNQLGLLQMLVSNQQQLINLQQQHLQVSKLQNSQMQHQILELQQQQQSQQQELQESKLREMQLQHQVLELQQQLQFQQPHEDGGESMIPQNDPNWPESTMQYVM